MTACLRCCRNHLHATLRRGSLLCLLAAGALAVSGCGALVDEDSIVIGEMQGDPITRGDLRMWIRELPPRSKPNLRTPGDVRRALDRYISERIKLDLARQYQEDGWNPVSPEQAAQRYFAENEEVVDIRPVTDPSLLDTDEEGLETMKAMLNAGIEQTRVDMLREAAVLEYIRRNYGLGATEEELLAMFDDDAYRREYEIRKDQLFRPETITVDGLLFPQNLRNVDQLAMAARDQLLSGQSIDAIRGEYTLQQAQTLQQTIPNRPDLRHMRSFWDQAAGLRSGDVLGPVVIAGGPRQVRLPNGRQQTVEVPNSYFVGVVEDYTPPVRLSLQEAKPLLLPDLLYAKAMDELRAEYEVETEAYEDNLPSPRPSGGTGIMPRGGPLAR